MRGIVSDIQGTARIVNYTGLVRGETQRLIKLELSTQQENEMIHEIRTFIDGLRNGNDELNLVRLADVDFQNKMQELDDKFSDLYKKIYLVRFKGAKNTDIIPESEEFFVICDEATGLAEKYSQKKATSLSLLEKYITADIVVLMLLIGYEFIKAIQYAAMNRLLQRKVYLDDATGLPNKNKCEELLSETEPDADTGVCSFDLNNLRRINDSRGHEAGDARMDTYRAIRSSENFLLEFETIRKTSEGQTGAKEQLQLYYEQLKQSILENDSYVDALLELSDVIYTVNLTKDVLERRIVLNGKEQKSRELFMDYPLPCSYQDYCWEYEKKITQETIAGYCMTDNCEKLRKRFENGETNMSVEYCAREDDGSIRWVQKTVLMTRMVVFDTEILAEVPMIYAIILLQDTTQRHERDEQEQARLQAAFNEMRAESRAKTNFLSRMSHDIRTPLNGIIGLLKIDETHFEDKELIRENHKKMKIAADYLLSLINDVLQMSKIEEGHIVLTHEYICLKDLIYEIESIITHKAADEDIQWIYEKNKEDIPYPYVYGSSLHLRQIFLNIYGNCIKYNRLGGKITTVMEAADVHDGICTYRWTISDTGIGMSPEFLSRIFDPFSQEKTDARSVYQGTGLGMAIAKGLIEQMHGSIEVASQVGVGSVFVITIPFEIAREQKKDEELAEKYDIRGLHLLAAEDNELNAEIIEMLLTDDGAKVTVAKNGRQVVEHFENNPPETFDAILMDVMMPVMDGIAATKAIRAMDRPDAKTIPIIAMTANAFEEDAKRCLAAGMTAHLAKPFQIEDVEKTIVECCGK